MIPISYPHRTKSNVKLLQAARTEYILNSTPDKTHKESGSVNVDVAVATQEDTLQCPAKASPLLPDTCYMSHSVGFPSCARKKGKQTQR